MTQQSLQARATALAQTVCPRCDGSGRIDLPSPRTGPNSVAAVLVWEPCPACHGSGYLFGEQVRKQCTRCEGAGYWGCGGCPHCGGKAEGGPGCRGLGWSGSLDMETWMEAGRTATGKILVLSNDGPGWRCDVTENRVGGRTLHAGWSTGWPDGEFELEGNPPYRPSPCEAVIAALEKAVRA
mgnify:CR=1 FL=1